MKHSPLKQLNWLKDQKKAMVNLLEQWATINSGSDNLEGLDSMLAALKHSFKALNGELKEILLPLRPVVDNQGHRQKIASGKALHICKHPQARAIFLGSV
jgi:hypothetical protein